jgi:hypothetical protein
MVRVVFVLLCGYRWAGVGVRQEAERKRAEDEAEAARQAEVYRQWLEAAEYDLTACLWSGALSCVIGLLALLTLCAASSCYVLLYWRFDADVCFGVVVQPDGPKKRVLQVLWLVMHEMTSWTPGSDLRVLVLLLASCTIVSLVSRAAASTA